MDRSASHPRPRPANRTEAPFELKGFQWLALTRRAQAACVKRAFEYWRASGFPYYKLSRAQMQWELDALSRIAPKIVFRGVEIIGNNAAVNFASSFHPQMWSVRVSRYLSPMECFQDDQLFRAAIERALAVWPNRHGANASNLRTMLKTFTGCAAVSNFKPSVARAVIDRFSSAGDTVVDFSAGYGGRLVGSLTLPRNYIGIDPSASQVSGLRRCIKKVQQLSRARGTADIIHGCAEDVMPTLKRCSAQLAFSSPPYHDWEKYSGSPSQSYRRYPEYGVWLRYFLGTTIEQCFRVLHPGGFLVVNVPNGSNRLPLADDLSNMAIECGFKKYRFYRLRLSKVAFLHPRSSVPTKWEQISVFQKPH